MKRSHLRVIAIIAAASAAVVIAALASEAGATPSKADLGLIAGVMQFVQRNYVHPVDSSQLTSDALKGMLSHLDPHSSYMTEREFRESEQDLNGQFGGIGLEIADHNGLPTIISPIDGTPAAGAGLQPGDVIAAINGQSTRGADLMQIITEIRGQPGTSVKLSIIRGVKPPFQLALTRGNIEVHSVKSKLEPDDIGYVRISEFGQDTPSEFRSAIGTLKQDAGGKLKGLVLDLRDDPGGLLSSAVDVSGDFLDGGTVVSIRGRRRSDDEVFQAPATGDLLPHTPVTVLINGASASASEIVAGALQDRHRVTVMGTQSFGKGSVQSVVPIKGHGAVRLTIALYYTPSGRSIQDEGITPNIIVEAPKDEQAPVSLIWRERQLHGAFANPGPLGKNNAAANGKPAAAEANSAPIREQLIGTAQDAQLAAALKFLEHAGESNSASGATGQPI